MRPEAIIDASSRSAGLVPLGLVAIALLGSVVIPARQSWLITNLLHETTEVLAPARLAETKLQTGLGEEMGALQGYALTGDATLLARYRVIVAANDARLETLERLATQLDKAVAAHLATVRERVDEWRRFNDVLVERRGTRVDVWAAVRAGQGRYDASLAAIAAVSSDLSDEAAARDSRVRAREHLSLTSNVALVLAAFAALTAVLVLTLRERRLAAALRHRADAESRRARQEGALREAAEALAGAFTIDEVTQRIARAALEAVRGRGAFVKQISQQANGANALIVGAVAGTGTPALGTSCELAGSRTEFVLRSGKPALILASSERTSGDMCGIVDEVGRTIAVPLAAPTRPVGALFVIGACDRFGGDDVARAAILGHLAALAYEKVTLLDEAIEGRERLERVVSSRSRLMRGFSHDVKNPIGAADGYAALLVEGAYGPLDSAQRESIGRMRRCMRVALSLIDDLHELGRAETGHLALSLEPVDLGELVHGIAEEYQAAAESACLDFDVDVAAGLPTIHTSRTRARQVVANLLSNAIKYTDAGSVTVRCERRSAGPGGDIGDWVVVEVSDTGRGIPREKLDFIFLEFGRLGGNDKSGAGLGLAISRLLAHALGGQITVTSVPGRGSTFTLWLPTS